MTNKEIPFMVRVKRKSDNRDFRPPNALKLGVLFEGHGGAQNRREARLPRTLSGPSWCVLRSFSADIPAGEWDILVRRGIEHHPIRLTVNISEGKTVEKTLRTKRWVDMAKRGWIAGDDHVHSRTINDADEEMLMTWAKAEDVNVVNALLMDDIKRIYFQARGFGKKHRIIEDNFAIVPGQEGPRTYDLGHVIGLNLTESVWLPQTYHCYDLAFDKLRSQQGAVVGYAHAHAGAFNVHRNMALNIPEGKIDFLEIFEGGWMGVNHYYPWLDLGFKITASAGSDVPWCGTMAEERVYVYTGNKKLDVDDWFASMKAGHTFVTNGPMLEFTVDEAIPGDTLEVCKGRKKRTALRKMLSFLKILNTSKLFLNLRLYLT